MAGEAYKRLARREALELAIRAVGPNLIAKVGTEHADKIVGTAKKFETYLLGDEGMTSDSARISEA